MIVLDASALLAFLFKEPGHDQVRARIGSSCMSAVNLAEVVGKFVLAGGDAQIVLGKLLASTVEIVPFAASDAGLAASLLPHTQRYGLSLADRACLALGIARGLPVLTADQAWGSLNIGVVVSVIR